MHRQSTDLTVVVLAAGQGRRLAPISLHHPKALTPVLGVPILARVIDEYRALGLTDFVVVRAPDCPGVDELCDSLRREGLSVRVAVQAEQLGTAHALLQARDLIPADFVLCSCDNLFPRDYLERLIKEFGVTPAPAIVTLEEATAEKLDRSAGVRLDGADVIEICEKPGRDSFHTGQWHAVAKFLYASEHRLLDYLDRVAPSPRGEMEFQDALALLVQASAARPRGVFAENCLHLTSEQDLIDIHRHYLARPRPYSVHDEANISPTAVVHEPVLIERGAQVGAAAVIGPSVYVGAGASIGARARLDNCVVYPGASVDPGETLSGRVRLLEIESS